MALLLKTDPLLTITFVLDPHDLIESQYRISLAPKQVKKRWKGVSIFTVIVFLYLFLTTNGFDFLPRILWVTAISAVVFFTGATAYVWLNKGERLRTQIEKDLSKRYPGGLGSSEVIGKRSVLIHENGIGILTDSEFSETAWKTITAICLLPDSLFFFLKPENFFEIPRAKISEQEFQKATELLRQNAPQHLVHTKFDYPL